MKAIAIVAALLLAAVAVQAQEFAVDEQFTAFGEYMKEFRKEYASLEELAVRFNNFKNSLARIEQLNALNNGAVYKINKFSDLSVDEFKGKYLNFKPRGPLVNAPVSKPADGPVAGETWDWRTQTPFPVTAVKDQQQCGSCWAFSTTEEIESMWIMAGNDKVNLSPQQIVSCDTTDSGCDGGWPMSAYQYVQSAGGIESDADYPYTSGGGDSGTCEFNANDIVAKISGFHYATTPCTNACTKQNETQLAGALKSEGPVSVCVYAESWQDYSSGVLSSDCPKAYDQLDHCVQAVGFNTNAEPPYWIVRNSWNTDWGLEGYIYVKYGENLCGIADQATIADI